MWRGFHRTNQCHLKRDQRESRRLQRRIGCRRQCAFVAECERSGVEAFVCLYVRQSFSHPTERVALWR